MSSEDDRERALREIVELTEQIGASVQGEADGQTEDGRPLEGYEVQHGEHNLAIITVPGWEYFQVIYQLDLPRDIAIQQAVSNQSTSQAMPTEVEVNQQDIQQATEDLQSHVEDYDLSDIRVEFTQMVAQVNSTAALDPQLDGQLIRGFQLSTKIFPYRDRFDIADFEAKVQDTVTAGWIATEFLSDAYNLEELVEEDMTSRTTDLDSGMFQ